VDHQRVLTLCKGCKIMLTKNICTEAGLTNGATGTEHDLILPPNDFYKLPGHNTIVCTKPPIILFKPDEYCEKLKNGSFGGMHMDRVIPIFPNSSIFRHQIIGQSSCLATKRHQLPILGGYAFTDYKVQGKFLRFSSQGKTFPKC
jgi:hypothetical protein